MCAFGIYVGSMSCNTNSQLVPKRKKCLGSPTASALRISSSSFSLEILNLIFNYIEESSPKCGLPFKILNLSLVCTTWQAAAELSLNQNAFEAPLAKMEYNDICQFLDILRKSAELGVNYRYRVQYIDVNMKHCCTDEYEKTFIAIYALCSSARGLRIQCSNFCGSLSRLLENTSITELQIKNLPPSWIHFLTKSSILRRLHSLVLEESSGAFPKNEKFLYALGSKAQELRCFEIRRSGSIIGNGIQRRHLHWPKLQYLLLPYCYDLSWEFVWAAIKACPNLREIYLPYSMTYKEHNRRLEVETLLQENGFQPRNTQRILWCRNNKDGEKIEQMEELEDEGKILEQARYRSQSSLAEVYEKNHY